MITNRIQMTAAGLLLVAGAAWAQKPATGDSRRVWEPRYPAVCTVLWAQFSTADRATPPVTDDTSRLQAALTACAGTGRSVLLLGTKTNDAFYSAMITVNGEGLVVGRGVTLEGNNSYASQKELVYVEGDNSFIGGEGAIDGRGDIITKTPRLVQTQDASNFVAYQVTLEQAAHPNLYIQGGNGATVWDVKVRTPATRANADGIDIDSITNVTVRDSSIEAGDDGVAIKTNEGAAGNITVEHNALFGTHGLSIGSQTFLGVTNVLFKDNFVNGTDLEGNASADSNAINIKTDEDCGGLVKQVTYENTCITQAKHLILVNAYYGSCSGTPGIPQFEDIVINGVKSIDSVSGAYETFSGYNSSNLAQVYLAHVDLDATTQSKDQNAMVYLDDSNVTPSGTDVTTSSFWMPGSVPRCGDWTGSGAGRRR